MANCFMSIFCVRWLWRAPTKYHAFIQNGASLGITELVSIPFELPHTNNMLLPRNILEPFFMLNKWLNEFLNRRQKKRSEPMAHNICIYECPYESHVIVSNSIWRFINVNAYSILLWFENSKLHGFRPFSWIHHMQMEHLHCCLITRFSNVRVWNACTLKMDWNGKSAANQRYEEQWVFALHLILIKYYKLFHILSSTKSTLSKQILIKVIYKTVFSLSLCTFLAFIKNWKNIQLGTINVVYTTVRCSVSI